MTTNDFKALNNVNGHSVFVSNIAGRKTRVSIVKKANAKNKNDGELVFQEIYSSWSNVPAADIDEAKELMAA